MPAGDARGLETAHEGRAGLVGDGGAEGGVHGLAVGGAPRVPRPAFAGERRRAAQRLDEALPSVVARNRDREPTIVASAAVGAVRDLVPLRVAHGDGGASVHGKVHDDLAQVGDGGLDAGDFEKETLAVAGALVEPHHGGHGGGYGGHGIGMGAVAGGVGRRVRVVAQPGKAGETRPWPRPW